MHSATVSILIARGAGSRRRRYKAGAAGAEQGRKNMLNRALIPLVRLGALAGDYWQTLVRVTFGLFVGSLIALLILLYAGVPVVGS